MSTQQFNPNNEKTVNELSLADLAKVRGGRARSRSGPAPCPKAKVECSAGKSEGDGTGDFAPITLAR